MAFRRIKHRLADILVTGGYCRQNGCGIAIEAKLPHNGQLLRVSITNFNPKIWHNAELKRRLLPNERIALAEKLKHKSAYALISELADENVKDGEVVPAHIPNKNQLRLIKSRMQCSEVTNPVIALHEMQKVHINCIQQIGYVPFLVYYSTPSQRAFYKKEVEYHRKSIISVDATGVGVISPTEDGKAVFLYVVCVQGNFQNNNLSNMCTYHRMLFFVFIFPFQGSLRTVPVFQMLSQSHDANSIRSWLSASFADKKKPHEVIIDGSEALISACIQAFSQCPTTHEYLNRCMKALLKKESPPPCLTRMDTSHFVKTVNNNKHLKSVHPKVGLLLKGVIGYLMKCDSLDAAATIVRKLLTLLKNEYINSDVISAQDYLTELIKTHETPFNDKPIPTDELDVENACTQPSKTTYRDTLVFEWVNQIYESIEIESGLLVNAFCSERLLNYIMEIISRIPMWSNLMCPISQSSNYHPTSSGSESEFKNIKKLAGIKTQRCDVFVKKHLSLLSGNLKLELSDQQNKFELAALHRSSTDRMDLERSKSENDIFDAEISPMKRTLSLDSIIHSPRKTENPIENWKGKARPEPLLRRAQNSILNPHDITHKFSTVPLFPNQYTAFRRIKRKIVSVSNTCAFDTIMSIYTIACSENRTMQTTVEQSNELNMFSFFVKHTLHCEGNKAKKNLCEMKTKILYEMYSRFYRDQIKEDDNTINIVCTTTFGPFLRKLLRDMDNGTLYSYQVTEKCVTCDIVRTESHPLMKVQLVKKLNLKRLSQHIIVESNASACRKCTQQHQIKISYGDLLAFDVEALENTNNKPISISEIQPELHIQDQSYKLFAVTEYVPSLQHFLAHINQSGHWLTYDDLQSKVAKRKNIKTTSMIVFALFYQKEYNT